MTGRGFWWAVGAVVSGIVAMVLFFLPLAAIGVAVLSLALAVITLVVGIRGRTTSGFVLGIGITLLSLVVLGCTIGYAQIFVSPGNLA